MVTVPWNIAWTQAALKDRNRIEQSPYLNKAKSLIAVIREDPYKKPPNFERLQGDFLGAYSRRINIQHRLVYQVLESEHTIKILSIWGHYEQ
ncbi:MAG: Txe/YoeB family addiction module toxin [Coriobacteriales bacterium]|jgi:Txe/YoeB family toxin of toxin-antitoxin system|nr:Txe/YoeB family addiction module toxin [Coriobacteriales bacterium]